MQVKLSTDRMISSMKYLIFFIIFFSILIFSSTVKAIYDPLSVPNNKFGIHIIDENDLDNAAKLVNSTGGDWGYVTVVISQNDRNLEKWQNTLDRMRQLHLIPLIRLATTLESSIWQKPKLEEALPWAEFLDSLNWVTQNRYVILFNEPNHAKEYGGIIDPRDYAKIISSYSTTLKRQSSDFFILPAGLDASAPNSFNTMDEERFLRQMLIAEPDVFASIDGWTSHSYPNPGFKGGIKDNGRGSLRTYLWEKTLLKKLGIERDIPIFITETGWPHLDELGYNNTYLSADYVATLVKLAAETIWNDPQIVAITPFVLNYQTYPFSNFSWQIPNTDKFYPQYENYQNIAKVAGVPILEVLQDKKQVLSYQTEASSSAQPNNKQKFSFIQFLLQFISSFF